LRETHEFGREIVVKAGVFQQTATSSCGFFEKSPHSFNLRSKMPEIANLQRKHKLVSQRKTASFAPSDALL
jgi:hypothetical protein